MQDLKMSIKENNIKRNRNITWIVLITLCAFVTSVVITFASDRLLMDAAIWAELAFLLVFILMGIFFDAIGIAVATAGETPFHSMAARKVPGATRAIYLIRNAEKVSGICNDVIGDISGIISGTTTAAIVARIVLTDGIGYLYFSLLLTGLVTAVTIGGKAICKSYAIGQANRITYQVAVFLYYIDKVRRKKGAKNGNLTKHKQSGGRAQA
ncbi:hypothetical protein FACS189492_0090 [Clostridia bacterium]|nr:hypothetical protein FACS189492_0090 [Clostridia bacterium]